MEIGIDFSAGDDQTVIWISGARRSGRTHFVNTLANSTTIRTGDALKAILKVQADLAPRMFLGGPVHSWMGVSLRESLLAVKAVPARIHKKRRWDRSGGYHARVQKKWRKRFGTVDEPCVYKLDMGMLGGRGPMFVIHPALMDRLRAGGVKFPTSRDLSGDFR